MTARPSVARTVKVLSSAGILSRRADHLVHRVVALRRYGPVPAAAFVGAARAYPNRPYVIDDEGTLTFGEVDARTDAIAWALHDAGIRAGDGVGVLCRNGRAWVEAVLACSKLGATVLFLNTDFAGPQLTDALLREEGVALISDEEFDRQLPDDVLPGRRWIGHHDGPQDRPTLDGIIAAGNSRGAFPSPDVTGRLVILTSGTTGAPKGASRTGAPIGALIGILDRLPFRAGQVHHIVAPLFHGWGLLHFTLGLTLPSTIVLRRRFDPEEVLRTIHEHRVDSVAMVPTMLQRMLQLPPEVRERYDTSSLSAIPLSGSAIPGDLAVRAMDAFGDVVFNFYGSTETGWATIATPEDLRAAPSTAGTPPLGTDLVLLDDEDQPVPLGSTGRIFVASQLQMAGYTDAGLRKAIVDGKMSTGDVGYLDDAGRLFVAGRDDDMIVSGGENVFPLEVEDLLATHPSVAEAAVIGVPDEEFGQRLKAFVVPLDGAPADADELRSFVRANLARYKVPREIVFLDELPRNPTGKVLKRRLVERP
jgi:fatty-acyl-CoA synthase